MILYIAITVVLVVLVILYIVKPLKYPFLHLPNHKSYVISIDNKRLKDFKDRLKPWNKHIEHYSGIVGKDLNIENTTLSKGQIGCLLSHASVWNKLLYSKYNTISIMEDDVDIYPNIKTHNRIKDALQELKFINWDVAFFGHNRRNSKINTEHKISKHWSRPSKCCGCFFYMVNRNGAEKLLTNLTLEIPVDNYIINESNKKHIQAICLNPRLCYVVKIESTTDPRLGN